MLIPNILLQQLEELLAEVRTTQQHELKPLHRLHLYHTFNEFIDLSGSLYTRLVETNQLDLPKGQQKYIRLAILTARYVLPVWQQAVPAMVARDDTLPVDLPQMMLDMAEGVLNSTVSPNEANNALCDDFYHAMGAIAYDVTYEVWCASNAAYSALKAVLGYKPFRIDEIDVSVSDDTLSPGDGDVALSALNAFTASDNDAPGVWAFTTKSHSPLSFDIQKRLEFWEWWLTEAIPQAWELAQETYKPE